MIGQQLYLRDFQTCWEVTVLSVCNGFTKGYPRNPSLVIYILSLIVPRAADYPSHVPGEIIYEVSFWYLVFHQIDPFSPLTLKVC